MLVKNNEIISTGYHHEYGKTHAEVDCFNNLKVIVMERFCM
ncbi:MAG: hypothetical protein ACLTA5_02670 [Anaerococcus obesiensis]